MSDKFNEWFDKNYHVEESNVEQLIRKAHDKVVWQASREQARKEDLEMVIEILEKNITEYDITIGTDEAIKFDAIDEIKRRFTN